MDLRYSESDELFRDELRVWLKSALLSLGPVPQREDWDERVRFDTEWQKKLFDAGYAGMNWPREYGGRDASRDTQIHSPFSGSK